MSVEIVGISSSTKSSPIPGYALNHLAELLKNADANIKINAYGQAWGPSSTQMWEAGTVAAFVLADPKNVWVDWCGWPGYWQVQTDGTLSQQGRDGWATLSADLGYKWLAESKFVVPDNFFRNPFGQNYPLSRGWDLGPAQNGVFYTAPSTSVTVVEVVESGLFGGTGAESSYPGAIGGYAFMADLHHGTSMGHYVYVAADQTNLLFPSGTSQAFVSAPSAAAFILKMLSIAQEPTHSRSRSGIGHGGQYNVNTLPPVSPTGPSSPYKGGKTPNHQYTPPPPRPAVNWVTAAEVAGAGAVVGTAGYFIAKAITERRG